MYLKSKQVTSTQVLTMSTESHRHFAGSIEPITIWEIIKRDNRYDIAKSIEDVWEQTHIANDPCGFEHFCTRFNILDKLRWDAHALDMASKQIIEDIREDGIQYATMTVSLNKIATSLKWDLYTAGLHVFERLSSAADNAGMKLNFLLSINYSWPTSLQYEMLNLVDPLGCYISGVDLVGNESMANWDMYVKPLQMWKKRGKIVRAHVGEWPGTVRNIDAAMHRIRVDRIAHGIYATQAQLRTAKDMGIIFDISLHSNIYTGASSTLEHPLRKMQDSGVKITLGTDDPVQFECTLKDEYYMADVIGADVKALKTSAFNLRIY